VYVGNVSVPASGARAYMIELTFPSAIPGSPYVFTTEVRVKSPTPLTPWPFYMPANNLDPQVMAAPNVAIASAEQTGDEQNAVALSLAIASDSTEVAAFVPQAAPAAATTALDSSAIEDSPADLMFAELSWLEADSDQGSATESDDSDSLLAALFDD
jgi:hypothetical protein